MSSPEHLHARISGVSVVPRGCRGPYWSPQTSSCDAPAYQGAVSGMLTSGQDLLVRLRSG